MSNKFKPKFHFSCPKGWMNDPNGFSFFKGEFHLYYQHNPEDTKWGPMHWGHATSKDLLHWKEQKIALYPDSSADNKGCFSGTALIENDCQYLMYTGVSKDGSENIQQQCLAVNDGEKISKFSDNPVIRTSDVKTEFCKTDFRDPKIWKDGNTYYCAAVIKKTDNNGAIALFTSTDLINWQYKNIIAETKGEMGGMWECPDVFKLDGKDVIIVSPQSVKADSEKGFHDGNNSVYMTGTLDMDKAVFTPDVHPENNFTASELDYGIDFYAPQTTEAPDGRRIMTAWLQAWESYLTPEGNDWSGMMIMPRELVIKNNCLIQKPVSEYEKMVENLPFLSGFIYKNMTARFTKDNYPQCDLTLIARVPDTKAENPDNEQFTVTVSDDKGGSVDLNFNSNKMELSFDRSNSINNGGAINRRSVAVTASKNKLVTFRFIFDTNSCECFINGGEKVFTNAYFLNKNVRKLTIDSSLTYGLNFKIINIK